jgi:hypothetical protein
MTEMVTIPRDVVERAIKAFEDFEWATGFSRVLACDAVADLQDALAAGEAGPVADMPAVVQVPQGLIEAVDRVLEEAHCDCPQRLRFDDGQHLSGCPLFDLNVARLAMLAAAPPPAAPQAEAHPVAWMVYTQDGQSVYVTDNPADIKPGQRALPLYTSPQPINKGE